MFNTKEEILLLLRECLEIRFQKTASANPNESKLTVALLIDGELIDSDFQTIREAE